MLCISNKGRKNKLRVSEMTVLRIFGPKRKELDEENYELHTFNSSFYMVTVNKLMMRMVGHVADMGEIGIS
jgi:hypothetical protein